MHKFLMATFIFGFLSATSLAAKETTPAISPCPDTAADETAEDCPWAGIARTLGEAIDAHEALDLKTYAPDLVKQLTRDSLQTELKALWGQSINFDALAKGIIVRPEILVAMAKIFDVPPPDGTIVMAGMEHTYGYLFSLLQTAFGYKRARWVGGEVETGFGFPLGVFSPEASKFKSSLFGDVSIFAGNIAFRDDPEQLKVIRRHTHYAAKLVQDFNFKSLKVTRVTEIIPESATNPRVEIHTDFVPFIHPLPDPNGDQYVLVYSINSKLITLFPVSRSTVEAATTPSQLGSAVSIATQYNGFVAGVSGKTFTGSRQVSTP